MNKLIHINKYILSVGGDRSLTAFLNYSKIDAIAICFQNNQFQSLTTGDRI
ncbi:hypothetical protein JYQ62_26990 [Nostoc sp. UHCC 0702]|nr:hypothetical protein JYQ62_26990 [Nostoc sp. UHCC 0702]